MHLYYKMRSNRGVMSIMIFSNSIGGYTAEIGDETGGLLNQVINIQARTQLEAKYKAEKFCCNRLGRQ